jgi:putative ABC transport system permease protein
MHDLLVSIKLALGNLRSNVGRTILSLLGIVIGVVSVILVLSLGAGVKEYVVGQIESFGSDIIQIEPKVPKVDKMSSQNVSGQFGKPLTTLKLDDAKAVAKMSNVEAWYGGMMSQQVVSYQNKNKQSSVMGMTADVFKVDEKTQVVSGEPFTEEDDLGLKQVAVLGNGIKKDFFGDADPIGQTIKIKGQTFRVKGVLKERGSSSFFDFDNTIYLPIRTLQKKLLGVDYMQFAVFNIKDMSKLEMTILEATDVMRNQHNIKKPEDDDFAVNSIVEIKNILDKVFNVVDYLLLALTSISLVVGGVGIMNVMYVAVTERTFEIGLRKSIGAKKSDILKQFLFEAIFLTVLGGILGVVLGFFLSGTLEQLASNFGYNLKFPVTWKAVLVGFGFSALTGLIFGIYPAKKASQLSPMEALRKE